MTIPSTIVLQFQFLTNFLVCWTNNCFQRQVIKTQFWFIFTKGFRLLADTHFYSNPHSLSKCGSENMILTFFTIRNEFSWSYCMDKKSNSNSKWIRLFGHICSTYLAASWTRLRRPSAGRSPGFRPALGRRSRQPYTGNGPEIFNKIKILSVYSNSFNADECLNKLQVNHCQQFHSMRFVTCKVAQSLQTVLWKYCGLIIRMLDPLLK